MENGCKIDLRNSPFLGQTSVDSEKYIKSTGIMQLRPICRYVYPYKLTLWYTEPINTLFSWTLEV